MIKKPVSRRGFLHFIMVSGVLAGCQRVLTGSPDAPPPVTVKPAPTRTVDLRFELENQAISYEPHPAGCDRTTIQGSVQDAAGSPLPGITLHIWAEDDQLVQALTTDADGAFSIDVAGELSEETYHIQIVEQDGAVILSDVIIAQAIPSCDLNLIVVNFIASSR